jgi:AsmA family protein
MTRTRKLLLGVGAAVVVAIAASAIALSSIDLNRHVAFVEAKAKEATGRELKLKGNIGFKLSLLPTVAADDVGFQNAPWGSRPLMASAKRVEVQIALLPLLTGEFEIRRVVLIEPDVLLEVNAKGEENWRFGPAKSAKETAPEPAQAGGIEVNRIEIRDGILTYRQAKPRRAYRARIERLALDTARGFETLGFDGKGALNDVPLDLQGRASRRKDSLALEDLSIAVGKSRATGALQLALAGARRPFRLRLDAPLIDLQDLYALRKSVAGDAGGAKTRNDGRVFPNDPFPLAALKALDGDAELRIQKLRLADGNQLDDIRVRSRFAQGKIDSDELKLRLQARELIVKVHADASSGRFLAVNATLAGEKVPLAALTGLLGVSPAPEGSPTDVDVRFSGRGDSVRTLMASANGDLRVVVGPGRYKNRALDVGADVTQLANALNPARSQDPYTEVKCAVLRFPVRNGIAKINNGIALETNKVRLIGGGTVNLRNEAIELGFRPEAASGLGVGVGNLARFAKVEGTLANPRIGLDMAGTASTAAAAGAAIATGGLTLLAGGLLIDSVPDNPCQVALTGAPERKKGVVDSVLDPLKKLFGK